MFINGCSSLWPPLISLFLYLTPVGQPSTSWFELYCWLRWLINLFVFERLFLSYSPPYKLIFFAQTHTFRSSSALVRVFMWPKKPRNQAHVNFLLQARLWFIFLMPSGESYSHCCSPFLADLLLKLRPGSSYSDPANVKHIQKYTQPEWGSCRTPCGRALLNISITACSASPLWDEFKYMSIVELPME